MSGERKSRRKVLYSIAVVVLIVAGVVGQFVALPALENERVKYFQTGAELGWKAGLNKGYEIGYTYGYIDGFSTGYPLGVSVLDNPYHYAAVEFEREHPWLDVLHFNVQEYILPSTGEVVTYIQIMIALPFDLPNDYNSTTFTWEVVRLIETLYDGEGSVVIWIARPNPLNGELYLMWGFQFIPSALFELGLENMTAEYAKQILWFAMPVPTSMMEWPGNPYYVVPMKGGGSGEELPK